MWSVPLGLVGVVTWEVLGELKPVVVLHRSKDCAVRVDLWIHRKIKHDIHSSQNHMLARKHESAGTGKCANKTRMRSRDDEEIVLFISYIGFSFGTFLRPFSKEASKNFVAQKRVFSHCIFVSFTRSSELVTIYTPVVRAVERWIRHTFEVNRRFKVWGQTGMARAPFWRYAWQRKKRPDLVGSLWYLCKKLSKVSSALERTGHAFGAKKSDLWRRYLHKDTYSYVR